MLLEATAKQSKAEQRSTFPFPFVHHQSFYTYFLIPYSFYNPYNTLQSLVLEYVFGCWKIKEIINPGNENLQNQLIKI